MQYSHLGRLVEEEWRALAKREDSIQTQAFVLMPNHLHTLIILPFPTSEALLLLTAFIQQFKINVMQRLNDLFTGATHWYRSLKHNYQLAQLNANPSIWSQSYQQQRILDRAVYRAKLNIIKNNPKNWQQDYLYPIR
jgi:REP element-mobilizing transposase RayT